MTMGGCGPVAGVGVPGGIERITAMDCVHKDALLGHKGLMGVG